MNINCPSLSIRFFLLIPPLATNRTRLVRKAHPTESFFNFFSPPVPPAEDALENGEIDEEELEDIEERLEVDYQMGEDLKEKVQAYNKFHSYLINPSLGHPSRHRLLHW